VFENSALIHTINDLVGAIFLKKSMAYVVINCYKKPAQDGNICAGKK